MARNGRYANGHRRRQLRARVLAEEDTCGICGQPVDRALRLGPDGKPHPLSPEVDEIIPFSLGGSPLERSNVRIAHRACNQRRGNGTKRVPPVPTQVVTSRVW